MIQGFFNTKRIIQALVLSLLLIGVGGAFSYAAPTPSVISYQGFLTSATGTAQTGTTTVTIRIYDQATSGTLLYEELHPLTPVTNGYFAVQIGSVGDVNGGTTAASITDLTFDRSYYVTVELAAPFSTGEMTLAGGTRSQLGTVPFATISYGALQATSSSSLTAQKGRMYFNTTSNELTLYNGSSWIPVVIQGASTTLTTLTVTGQTTLANASTTNLTVSNSLQSSGLTVTNATSSTFFATLLNAVTAVITNLTATNATATNLGSTNANITNGDITNLTTVNATTTGTSVVTGTSTLATTTMSSLVVGTSTASPRSQSLIYVEAPTSGNALVIASATASFFSVDWLGKTKAKIMAIGTGLYADTTTTSGGDLPTSTFTVGRYMYVSNYFGNDLQVFDVFNKDAPLNIGSVTLPGAPTTVFVSGNYAYTGNDYDSSLSVIDITNPTSPTVVSTLTIGDAPNSVQVSGNYAYIANYSPNVVIVDVSSTTAMQIATSTLTGGDSSLSVYVSGNTLYVASLNGVFSIFDITTPTDPVRLSTIRTAPAGGSFAVSGNISVVGGYAYVSSYENNSVAVVDVSNPAAPTIVRNVSTGQGPFAVYVSDSHLYVANNTGGTVSVFNLSTPSNPRKVATLTVGQEPHSVQVVDGYLYVTNAADDTVSIFNVSDISGSNTTVNNLEVSNLTTRNNLFLQALTEGSVPFIGTNGQVSQNNTNFFWNNTQNKLTVNNSVIGGKTFTLVATSSVDTSAEDVYVEGNYAYVANYGDNTLSVINITNPLSPVLAGTTTVGANPLAVFVAGGYAYVPNYDGGSGNTMSIVDVSTPSSPSVVGVATTGTAPHNVVASGNYAYVVNAVSGSLSVIDVTTPSSPATIASLPTGTDVEGIAMSGSYVFVSNYGDSTISVVDVSDPNNPILATTTPLGHQATRIQVSGNYLYTANYDGGSGDSITVIDITTPTAPVVLASKNTKGSAPYALRINASKLYVANRNSNDITIFDISSPSVPVFETKLSVLSSPTGVMASSGYMYVSTYGGGSLEIYDIGSSNTLLSSVASIKSLVVDSLKVTGLTSGAIPFVSSSGHLTDSGSALFWDSAKSSLAIGGSGYTDAVLTLTGNASHSGNGILQIRQTDQSGDGTILFINSGVQGTYNDIARITNTLTGSNGGNLIFGTKYDGSTVAATERMRITSNGNIGIGTSSPLMRLMIETDVVNEGVIISNTNMTHGASVPLFLSSMALSTSTNVNIENLEGSFVIRTGAATLSDYGFMRMLVNTLGDFSFGGTPTFTPPAAFSFTGRAGIDAFSIASSTGDAFLSIDQFGSLLVGASSNPRFLVNTTNDTTNIGTSTGLASLFVQGTSTLNPLVIASSTGASLLTLLSTGDLELPKQLITSGITWTQGTTTGVTAITYGDGVFVAAGSDGIFFSNDASTWRLATTTNVYGPNAITYGGGQFVAVEGSGSSVLTSVDGEFWTSSPTGLGTGNWSSVTYGNGLYIMTDDNGDNVVAISRDGKSWSARSVGGVNYWYDAVYGNGRFVLVGENGTDAVAYSLDGETWQLGTKPSTSGWQSVVYGSGVFVAVANDGSIATSIDGDTWTAQTSPSSNWWRSVTYGNGLFVAVSSDGTNRVITSPDGIVWTERTGTGSNAWYDVTYGNGIFVGATVEGIMTSGKVLANTFSSKNTYQGGSSFFGGLRVGTTTSSLATLFVQSLAGVTPFAVASSSGNSLFTVLANGNVGIGTSNPNTSLHLEATGVDVVSQIKTDVSHIAELNLDSGGFDTRLRQLAGTFYIDTELASSTFAITSTGEVGVGSTTPSAKFSIQASNGYTGALFDIASTTSSGYATSSLFKVLSNGNVGIGTSTGIAKLNINQSGNSYGLIIDNNIQPRIDLNTTQSGASNWNILNEGNVNRFSVRQTGGGPQFYIESGAAANTLIVSSSSNIGIGSTTPNFKLTVVGGGYFGGNLIATGTLAVSGQTTLSTASTTALTATAFYNSALYGTTALLGTTTNIFDSSKLVVQGTTTLVGTASNPTALKVIGNIDNTFAQDDWPRLVTSTTTAAPGDLAVSDGFMYIISSAELSIYNVADIRNPLLISTSSANGNSIKVVGNYAYITGPSFSIVDVTDKRAPVQVGSVSYGSSYGYSAIRGQYAYVSSSVENTLKVIDISNPRQPRVGASLSVGSSPRDLDISGSTLYLVEHGAGGNLFSIDISNPLNPVLLDTLSVASGLQSVKVSGGYVYVQRFTGGGLYVVNGSNPSDLVQIASIGTGSGSNELKIAGGYAYVPNYNAHTISIVDIRNPYSPALVKNISTSNNPSSLFVTGKNLYVTNYGAGVISFYELPSLESASALIHSLETGNLSVRNSLTTSGLLNVGTGLTVGGGGFLSRGNSSVYGSFTVGTSTYPNFLVNTANNTTNIGTSTGLASLFIQGTSTLNLLTVASSSGASLFTILADGSVGVGTTSMSGSSKFFVDGSINISQNFALRANDNWLIGQSSTTNTISIGSTNVANDIQFNSSAGTDLFTIKSDGNVGIGSTTPFAKLTIGAFSGTGIALTPTDNAAILSSFNDSATGDPEQLRISHNFARVNIDNLRSSLNLQSYGADVVIGTTSAAGSRLDIYNNTSATSTDMFRILSDVGSVGDVVYKIKANGDIFTDGNTTIGTPADLAENYPTLEEDIIAGTVVSLSTTTLTWSQSLPNGSTTDYEIATVKKAVRGEEALGVISTRPGILLGGNTTRGVPVAFSGRVPVYVSNENGVVKKGDFLTISSSTPGYAMKQTSNGQSVGRALSDQSEYSTSSLVMMAVENVNRTISFTDVAGLALLDASSTLSTLTIRETLRERLLLGYSIVREYVAVTIKGVTGYFDTLFAKDIYTETICVKKSDGTNVCLNGDQVENVLNASNIPLLQNTPTVSGTTTDEEGAAPEEESSSSDDNATTTPQTDEGDGGEIESSPAESGPETSTEGTEGEASATSPVEAE